MAKNYAPIQRATNGHSVKIGNQEMYYEEYGTGEPLVLLHGFGGCSQNWHTFTGELSEYYRLIIVDLRGHGYSGDKDNTFTHRDAAEDVFLLLEKLRITNFLAMGMSTGGMTLLHMATRQPTRIRAMILISATSHFPDQARTIMRRVSFATLPPEVRAMYSECAKRGDEQIRQLIAQFNAMSENYDDMNFDAQSLSKIKARTLIVHGDRDVFFPIEIPVNMYKAIPDSALWIIPGGDHVPIFDPTVPFSSTALQFLRG